MSLAYTWTGSKLKERHYVGTATQELEIALEHSIPSLVGMLFTL